MRYYADWSHRNGVTVVTSETDDNPKTYAYLRDLIKACKRHDQIILETPFEAFSQERRAEAIKLAEDSGVLLRTTPPRVTIKGRRRNAWLHNDPSLAVKSDENDARAIAFLARTGQALKAPTATSPIKDKVAMANRDLMLLRRGGTTLTGPRGGSKVISHKEAWARALADTLPPFAKLPQERKQALGAGDKQEYNLTLLAAVAMAARHADGRDEFDTLTGLYSHAYPTQIRADIHHWAWAGGSKRQRLRPAWKETGHGIRVDSLSLTDFRREVRWLGSMLRKAAKTTDYPA